MRSFAFFLLVPLFSVAPEPLEIPLWEKGPPGFEGRKNDPEKKDVQKSGEYKVTNVHNPTITVFLPPKEKATGVGVVIAPGGGFRELWMMHEGSNASQWLNERGIAAADTGGCAGVDLADGGREWLGVTRASSAS